MRNIHRDPNISEMKAITQPNQRKGDDVMQHQLPEILPRLLQLQQQHYRLLGPIRRLQQVVGLETRLVRSVREAFVHARCAEIPDGRAAHDV